MTTSRPWRPWLESCLTALDPAWWIPPFKARLGQCFSCDYNTVVHPDFPVGPYFFCVHCLAGCPIYGGSFRCEYEIFVMRGLYELTRGGVLRPFPGDWDAGPGPQGRPDAASRGVGYGLLRVFRQVNLAEYASRFTHLAPVKPGRWKGRCPIHDEKTPSFYVSANPWRWRCFGACATGGDLIKLIAELRRVEKWPG